MASGTLSRCAHPPRTARTGGFGAACGSRGKKIGLQPPTQRRPDVYYQPSGNPKWKSRSSAVSGENIIGEAMTNYKEKHGPSYSAVASGAERSSPILHQRAREIQPYG